MVDTSFTSTTETGEQEPEQAATSDGWLSGIDRCHRRFQHRPAVNNHSGLLASGLGVKPQVLILALARMAEAIGNSFLIIVLPLFVASDFVTGGSFGIAEVTITGIVLALFGFVNSPLQPITGGVSDRTGRRKIFLLAGLGLLGASSLAYAIASTYWHLVAVCVLQGVAGALIVPTSIALVNDVATEDDRGRNMGVYNAFRLIGFGIGPIGAGIVLAAAPYSISVGGFRIGVSGFGAAFSFAAATALIGFVLVLIFVCDPEIDSDGSGSDADEFVVFDRTGGNLFDPVFALGVVSFLMTVGLRCSPRWGISSMRVSIRPHECSDSSSRRSCSLISYCKSQSAVQLISTAGSCSSSPGQCSWSQRPPSRASFSIRD